jgi:hypothetical protein
VKAGTRQQRCRLAPSWGHWQWLQNNSKTAKPHQQAHSKTQPPDRVVRTKALAADSNNPIVPHPHCGCMGSTSASKIKQWQPGELWAPWTNSVSKHPFASEHTHSTTQWWCQVAGCCPPLLRHLSKTMPCRLSIMLPVQAAPGSPTAQAALVALLVLKGSLCMLPW